MNHMTLLILGALAAAYGPPREPADPATSRERRVRALERQLASAAGEAFEAAIRRIGVSARGPRGGADPR